MSTVAFILVLIVAAEHLYIMILEMFLFGTPVFKRTFRTPDSLMRDRNVKVMMANQGLYNGFLAAGLLWGLFFAGDSGRSIQLFFVCCVIIAAWFGGFTAQRSIIVKQGLPAMAALVFLLLS
ncbi:membrane protein [Paenibacillus stellifer]|uniref:Membrane protein n=1 Tax=Paenibacillus stellifer TaxID=169760 RepID=A0A089M1E3_9BACL|nr:DUF1304 domain-containing protein [Paenibacillus stellifer]AIQ65313.1 membrane protein [Paenibacillus stellifer]